MDSCPKKAELKDWQRFLFFPHPLKYLTFLAFVINDQDMNSLTSCPSPREQKNTNLVVEEVENFMLFAGAEASKQVIIFAGHGNWD